MNPRLRNIMAFLGGLVAGSVVNMLIVTISPYIIPSPAGVDSTTMEGLKASMHLFEPRHFIFPFLAHAAGTLVGAYTAAKLAVSYKTRFALGVGIFFLAGGISSVLMLPSPAWFTFLDLAGAYIPMAYLGAKLALKQTDGRGDMSRRTAARNS